MGLYWTFDSSTVSAPKKGSEKKVSNQIKSGIFLVVLDLRATNMTLVFILDPHSGRDKFLRNDLFSR